MRERQSLLVRPLLAVRTDGSPVVTVGEKPKREIVDAKGNKHIIDSTNSGPWHEFTLRERVSTNNPQFAEVFPGANNSHVIQGKGGELLNIILDTKVPERKDTNVELRNYQSAQADIHTGTLWITGENGYVDEVVVHNEGRVALANGAERTQIGVLTLDGGEFLEGVHGSSVGIERFELVNGGRAELDQVLYDVQVAEAGLLVADTVYGTVIAEGKAGAFPTDLSNFAKVAIDTIDPDATVTLKSYTQAVVDNGQVIIPHGAHRILLNSTAVLPGFIYDVKDGNLSRIAMVQPEAAVPTGEPINVANEPSVVVPTPERAVVSAKNLGEKEVTEFEEIRGDDGFIIWKPKHGTGLEITRPEGAPQPVVLEREGGFVIELQGEDNLSKIQAKGATVTIRDVDNPQTRKGTLRDNIYFELSDETAHKNTLVRPEVAITNGEVRVVDGIIIIDQAETVTAEGYRIGDTLQTAAIVLHEGTLIQSLFLDGLANVRGPLNVDPKQFVREMKLLGSNSWNGEPLRQGWTSPDAAAASEVVQEPVIELASEAAVSQRELRPVTFFPGYKDGVRQPLPRIVEDVVGEDGIRMVTFEAGYLGSLSIPKGTKVYARGLKVEQVRSNGGKISGAIEVDTVRGQLAIEGIGHGKSSVKIKDIEEDGSIVVSNSVVEITGDNKGVVELENDSSLTMRSGRYAIPSHKNTNIIVNGRTGPFGGSWQKGDYLRE